MKSSGSWYARIEDVFTAELIAAAWSRRDDATPAAREALRARVDEPKRLLLSVAAGDSRAEGDAAELIEHGNVFALYGAADVARMPKVPGAWRWRLSPSTCGYRHAKEAFANEHYRA